MKRSQRSGRNKRDLAGKPPPGGSKYALKNQGVAKRAVTEGPSREDVTATTQIAKSHTQKPSHANANVHRDTTEKWPEHVDLSLPARVYVYYIFDASQSKPMVLTVENDDSWKLPLSFIVGHPINGGTAAQSRIDWIEKRISQSRFRLFSRSSGRYPGGIEVKKQTDVGWCVAAGEFQPRPRLFVNEANLGALMWRPLEPDTIRKIQPSYLPGFSAGCDSIEKMFPSHSGLVRGMGDYAKRLYMREFCMADPDKRT